MFVWKTQNSSYDVTLTRWPRKEEPENEEAVKKPVLAENENEPKLVNRKLKEKTIKTLTEKM